MNDFDFSRWAFLTEPLPTVLTACQARLTERPATDDFLGGIIPGATLDVQVPEGQNPLERDSVVRGLLACWHGVDVADWPVPMVVTGKRAA
ncbi:hypothetical protein [Streptomyces canus]|uniref:hypothetical protein n=1 Tax=Streptomyces canus TaxID=58343 RepID=UPI00037AD637|nr:hypothetical protein [Streptomyces canus]